MVLQQAYRLFCKSRLRVFSALIFHHTVAFLLLTHPHGGQSQAIDQPQRIEAIIGNGITLPCHVKAATDVADEMLEWSRPDLNPRFVHMRRSGKDRLGDQNPAYKGRTSVSTDGLKHGDVSLMLSQVKISDEGQYRCFVPSLNTESHVQLVAVSWSTLVEITIVSKGVLQCASEGWYPEPEVLWLDGEGNLLSAGPTETVRGPDDLYTVSSKVTVEKRHSNSFTCRVQQNNINQTTQTHIQVPDDFFVDSSDSSVSTIVGLVVGIMFILAVLFVVWRLRQNKMKNGKFHLDEETQRAETGSVSEQQSLIQGETDREKATAENGTRQNQNKGEGQNNVECSNEKPEVTCQIEEETPQEKTEATKPVNTETPAQGLLDGDGQQQIMAGGQARNDTDKEKNNQQTQTTNNNPPDQAPTDPTAGQGTKTESEKREEAKRGEEKEQQNKNSNGGDDGEKTTEKENSETDQLSDASAQSDLNKKDGGKETNSNNETATEGPADEEPKQSHPAGGENNNDSKKSEDTRDTVTPGSAESETHQGQPDKNVDKKTGEEGTNPVHTATQSQDQMDGDGQQKDRKGGEANNDINMQENKEQTTNNNPAGQVPTDETTPHKDVPAEGGTGGDGPADDKPVQGQPTAGGKTNHDLNKIERTEDKNVTGPAKPERILDKKNGEEDKKSVITGKQTQDLRDGDGRQEVGAKEERDNDTDKQEGKEQTTNNNPAGQDPTDETTPHKDLPTGGETGGDGPADEKPVQSHPTAGGETNHNLKKIAGTEDKNVTAPAKPERILDKEIGEEDKKSVITGKQTQDQMDEDGQQEVGGKEKTNNDTDKQESKEQTTNNNPAGQDPTDETTPHKDVPTGGGTKTDSEKTEKTENNLIGKDTQGTAEK